MLRSEPIRTALAAQPRAGELHLLERVDSTNDYAKTLAAAGAPHGTVVLSEEQTAGRGRQGRGFISPPGLGLYASFLLRPQLSPQQLLPVTAMVAVAACRAIEGLGLPSPRIKWVNDLILGEKKLGGILTEFSSGALILGIGINVSHRENQFPPELQSKATSLLLETGHAPPLEELAARLIGEIFALDDGLLSRKDSYLRQYEGLCLTLGREVLLCQGETRTPALCTGLDQNGALLVRYPDGTEAVVSWGEVSVRGRDGYL